MLSEILQYLFLACLACLTSAQRATAFARALLLFKIILIGSLAPEIKASSSLAALKCIVELKSPHGHGCRRLLQVDLLLTLLASGLLEVCILAIEVD